MTKLILNPEELRIGSCAMLRTHLFLFFILNLLFISSAFAQTTVPTIRHLSVSDGLSQSSVIDVTQDKYGFLWFATRDGLNKYDGHKFTVYNKIYNDSSSISSNDIFSVMVDSDGDLWVGTLNGLNKYDYSKDAFVRFYNDAEDSSTLSDNSVWSIFESSNGEIWVGTSRGLNRFNKTTGTFTQIFNDPENEFSLSHNYILDIFEDKEGFLWVGTAKGLNKLNKSNKGKFNFTRFLHDPENDESLSDDYIQTIAEDEAGNLWIGTRNGGLNKLMTATGNFKSFKSDTKNNTSLSNDNVRSLAFDKKGRLWVGTYNGLNLMENENQGFKKYFNDKNDPVSLSKNSIKSIFIDKSGTIWIGTYYGGVNILNDHFNNFKNYKYRADNKGLRFDVISAIVEDKNGKIYIGTEGGGVNVLDLKTGEYDYILKKGTSNSLSNNNVKSLYLDDEDNLYIGTFGGGLNILNLKTRSFKTFRQEQNNPNSLNDDNVYAILPQNDSIYLIGTFGGGLNIFNKNKLEFTHTNGGVESSNIRNLLKDSKGNLWMGTQYGLNYLSAEKLKVLDFSFKSYFFDRKSQAGEDVTTIFEDSKSRIWIGTNESGLSFYDETEDRFVNYDLYSITGATSNVVHGILEDKHQNLWISTNNGILKLNPGDNTYKIFDESNGLISNEYNNSSCLRTSDGHMYFGSLEGLTVFHPDSIATNTYAPPVVLTDFKLFGESVKPGSQEGMLRKIIGETKTVTLDYDQAIFTIEFSIPNFVNSGNNRYAYRLKGLEDKWNFTNSNNATYTIQKAGTYDFEVKGANNDGVWNNVPTVLTVKVNPAPWKTWWAFLFYAIVIGVALALLINIIFSRSRLRHELELEHINHERQESLNQMKLQFFTNISHEFRTPLTLILGPLEQIISNYEGSNWMYKQLNSIEKNASRLLRLIDQLMDFRKFENNHLQLKASENNIISFVENIYLSFKQYADLHKFKYHFIHEERFIYAWFDRDKMERVIFNLISNAFKYTPDGGDIQVVVRRQGECVEILVVDNGIGMAEQHLEKIFERFYEIDHNDSRLKTKYSKGTGIGLALAKGIVELHSGKIKVESKENEGSTFTLILPLGKSHFIDDQLKMDTERELLVKSDEIDDLLGEVIPEKFAGIGLAKNTPCILVVEDNTEVRNYIVELFTNTYQILEAATGKQGLQEALQNVPDLVISDVMMPEMDGIELCKAIKSNIKTSHIPCILLTARTSVTYKHEGLEMGADDYINKPFNVKELKIKVKNLITSRQALKEKFSSDKIVKPGDITVTSADEKLLESALKIAEDNISNELFDVSTFCEELGVSRTMLFTKIKAWTNLTPNDFMMVMRMKRAAQLLEQNKLNISQVGFQVGFKNPKYFSKCFQKHFSETPSTYAKKFSSASEVKI